MKRLALLALVSLLSCDPDGDGTPNPNFLVVGHHGAPNLAPENTIAGFQASVAVGANAMEVDLCVTKDGSVVAFHDRDPDDSVALARQAGGEGYKWIPFVPDVGSPWRRPVSQLTLAELRQSYGYRLLDGGRDPTVVIPTLADVLEWARTSSALKAIYFDLKFDLSELAAGPQVVRELADALDATPDLKRVRFYLLTVHPEIIKALQNERRNRRADPLRIVWDFEQPGALPASTGAGLRDISMGLTPSFTWSGYKRQIASSVRARDEGSVDSVLAWTFDREDQLAELLYYSVDGIITNDPATLARMWKETLR